MKLTKSILLLFNRDEVREDFKDAVVVTDVILNGGGGAGHKKSRQGDRYSTFGQLRCQRHRRLVGQLQNEPRFRFGFSWYVSEHCEGDTILTAGKRKKKSCFC